MQILDISVSQLTEENTSCVCAENKMYIVRCYMMLAWLSSGKKKCSQVIRILHWDLCGCWGGPVWKQKG